MIVAATESQFELERKCFCMWIESCNYWVKGDNSEYFEEPFHGPKIGAFCTKLGQKPQAPCSRNLS